MRVLQAAGLVHYVSHMVERLQLSCCTLQWSWPSVVRRRHTNNNNSIKLFVYLRAELNSRWPITESVRSMKNK
jgi:hypothetical protein